jgi:TetR/AcrR family transcriptional regulator, transcriptional repressor for nem operon
VAATTRVGAPRRGRKAQPDTAQRILDVAERLVQQRGFNGFSYADVAAQLGITKASLHYHFPSKASLGQALVGRYAARFAGALRRIDTEAGPAPDRLAAYAELYADVIRVRRMCLCGMLAAEYRTLPKSMMQEVVAFFDSNEEWLAHVLEQGRNEGTLRFDGSARDSAGVIIGALEGAMLVARPYGDVERFETTVRTLLASFATGR